MRQIVDKLILFCGCFLLLPFPDILLVHVVSLLTAVTISALNGCFGRKFAFCSGAVCFLLCLQWPQALYFLPLIGYDLVIRRPFWSSLLCLFPLLTGYFRLPFSQFLLIFVLTGLAALLKFRTDSARSYQSRYRELQDSARELSLNLQKQNRELMEKQDTDLRVAKLDERNRIAREIHDNVGHMLTRSILQVGAMQVTCKDNAAKEQLAVLNGTLTEAMNNIRSSIHDLHDESIDLKSQVEQMVQGFSFCPIRLNYDAGEMDKAVKYCLSAVVKEALSNIIKHSNATSVAVTVREHPAFYQLIVQDNGTAFSPADQRGIGLKNMEDRVAALHGTFRAERKNGFRLFLSIPKEGY